jgi:hypothetical protein
MRSYLKKPFTKRAGGVAQGVGPEFKPQYHKKKKKKKRKKKNLFFLGCTLDFLGKEPFRREEPMILPKGRSWSLQ